MRWPAVLVVSALAAACAGPPSPAEVALRREEILGSNALMSNALMSNALMSNALMSNALMSNALMSNALASNALMSNALMSNALRPDGFTEGELARQFLSYVYSCAMPVGARMKLELGAEDYGTLEGGVGLAPEWGREGGRCDDGCQRFVSACLLARTNFWGVPVKISLRGDHPNLVPTDDEMARYPLREGAYFGNLFVNNDRDPSIRQIFACAGPGSNVPQLTSRFCSGGGGVCAIRVLYDCVNPAQRHACARQDPNEGTLRDCYTGGIGTDGQTQGAHFDEAITVYLQEPVAVCGDGVCTGSETPAACAADCSRGWARTFPSAGTVQGFVGDGSSVVGMARLPDGGQAVAIASLGSIDLGLGPLPALPLERSLVVGRLDVAGRTIWARQIGYGLIDFIAYGPLGAFTRADAAGNVYVAVPYWSSIWAGDAPLAAGPGQSVLVARVSAAGELSWARRVDGWPTGALVEPDGGLLLLVTDDTPWLVSFSGAGETTRRAFRPEAPCTGYADLLLGEADGDLIVQCQGVVTRWDPRSGSSEDIPYPRADDFDAAAAVAPAPAGGLFVLTAREGKIHQVARDGTTIWTSEALPSPGGMVANARGELAVFGSLTRPATVAGDLLVPAGYPAASAWNGWVAKLGPSTTGWVKQLGGLGITRVNLADLDAGGTIWVAGDHDRTGAFDGWILDSGGEVGSAFVAAVPDPTGK